MQRQFEMCESCLWEEYCTDNGESWKETSLIEEERVECEHYCLTGENRISQYMEDLTMRQGYYDRNAEEAMGFASAENQRELSRVLREYGL